MTEGPLPHCGGRSAGAETVADDTEVEGTPPRRR